MSSLSAAPETPEQDANRHELASLLERADDSLPEIERASSLSRYRPRA